MVMRIPLLVYWVVAQPRILDIRVDVISLADSERAALRGYNPDIACVAIAVRDGTKLRVILCDRRIHTSSRTRVRPSSGPLINFIKWVLKYYLEVILYNCV